LLLIIYVLDVLESDVNVITNVSSVQKATEERGVPPMHRHL